MQSSDELLGLNEGQEIDSTELQSAAEQYLQQLRMQQMLKAWTRGNKSKHNAARALRAKSRISKRKSKR